MQGGLARKAADAACGGAVRVSIYDRFDRVFSAHFKGIQQLFGPPGAEIPEEWLRGLFDRLFTVENPDNDEAGSYQDYLNPESAQVAHGFVEPAAAEAIGLAIHELTTNAVKYGALSETGGTVNDVALVGSLLYVADDAKGEGLGRAAWDVMRAETPRLFWRFAAVTPACIGCSMPRLGCCMWARPRTLKSVSPVIFVKPVWHRKPLRWSQRSRGSKPPSPPTRPKRCCWSRR